MTIRTRRPVAVFCNACGHAVSAESVQALRAEAKDHRDFAHLGQDVVFMDPSTKALMLTFQDHA